MTITHTGATHQLLIVEDDPGDVLLTREALSGTAARSTCTSSGTARRLSTSCAAKATTPTAPRPDLVLLDLNLPRLDGREVLARIKSDPGLRTHPRRRPDHVEVGRGRAAAATTSTPTPS